MHNHGGGRIYNRLIRKAAIIGLVTVMPFANSILAGETLVRPAMQSEAFQSGVQGWRITRQGDAEFNNATVRGELIVGQMPGQYVRIGKSADLPLLPPVFEMSTGSAEESQPGFINATGSGFTLQSIWQSPVSVDTGRAASIVLNSHGSPVNRTEIDINADDIIVSNPIELEQSWTNLTLVNSWVDSAGARAGYFKDATGRVQLRGQVSGGSVSTIATLPVGYRPSQTMEWITRDQTGVVLCAIRVATTGLLTVAANLTNASSGGIRLDAASYPTAF